MVAPLPETADGRRLEVLDYLRFVAAVAVVWAHWTFSGINNDKIASLDTHTSVAHVTQYGYLGVEVFFMVSGYVILISASGRSARRFAVGRALRLYPAFWVAMLTTAVVTVLWGQESGLRTTIPNVIANLTMVPELLGSAPIDGVYWTLVYEVFFYLLVFVLLFVAAGEHLTKAIGVWAAVLLVVALAAPQLGAYPYLDGYFALFCVGGILSEIHRNGPKRWSVGALLCAMAATGIKVHHVAERQATFALDSFRPWVALVVVALAAMCIASLRLPQVAALRLPAAAQVGALTYPLYLLHAHIGFIVITQLGTEANRWWLIPLLFVAMLAASWALHRVVEVGMKPLWLGLFLAVIDRPLALLERRREPAPSSSS